MRADFLVVPERKSLFLSYHLGGFVVKSPRTFTFPGSSTVEQIPVKNKVRGSNPRRGALC